MNISHKMYGAYSGPKVTGDLKYFPPSNANHWERVFAVTANVESSSMWGSIVAYDGTCITAGLHQALLVYPRELEQEDFAAEDDQGSLVNLLRLLEFIPNFTAREALWHEFKKQGWYVAPDSRIRYSVGKVIRIKDRTISVKPGDVVFGADLRNTITPVEGRVPSGGPSWNQAANWASLFHSVFNNPLSFPVQIKFGTDHSMHLAKTMRLSNGLTVSQFIYDSLETGEPLLKYPELDLAMTLFWCNSVNSPAMARQLLDKACIQVAGDKNKLGRVLLRTLGTSSFGRWSAEVVGGRYQRARAYMITKNYPIWRSEFFAALGCMPQIFRGAP